MIENKDEILRDYEAIIHTLTDTTALDTKTAKLTIEINTVFELLQKCVDENAHSALDQSEYEKKYSALTGRYEKAKMALAGVNDECLERTVKHEAIMGFMQTLRDADELITEFDEDLWNWLVEKAIVLGEHEVRFVFKDGLEVVWGI